MIFTPEARTRALEVTRELRGSGIICSIDLMGRGFSAQMKNAGKSADYAVIIGEDEVRSGMITVKNMKGGEQQTLPLADAIETITAH